MKKYLLLLFLAACSGAVDGPGAGGAVGGGGPKGPLGGTGDFAQGTLGSQSDIQEMGDECLSSYSLRFSGEDVGAQLKNWILLQPEQKVFPTPGLIVKPSKEPIVNEEICAACAGRIVRVIDFGNPGLNPFTRDLSFGMFSTSIWKQFVKPEIVAQARYQDFVVSAVGDVSFKDLSITVGHVYLLMLSAKPMEPVTVPTAFTSAEELYAVTACSDKPDQHPFMRVRLFEARNSEPGSGFKPIPQDNEATINLDQFKATKKTHIVIPAGDPAPDSPVELDNTTDKFQGLELTE